MKAELDEYAFLDDLRENIPPDDERENSLDQLREFAQWLLIVPLITFILFGCGQIAIYTTSEAALEDTQSKLSAEYGLWPYVQTMGLRADIIEEIKSDGSEFQISRDTYNDPVEVTDGWVEGELPPIVIAQLPGAGTPVPNGSPTGSSPDPGDAPTAIPSATNSKNPTASPTASITNTPWPTATAQPTSTDNPSATRTFTPIPSNTPTKTSTPPPTIPGAPTWTPSPTATRTSTPTKTPVPSNTPTNTPIPPSPTNTPIPPTSPPDYCANISWPWKNVEDWQNFGTVIKFAFGFKNNNAVPMTLTSYSVSWTDNGLAIHRAKTIVAGSSDRPKLLGSHGSSPASNCESCPVTYAANSGTNEFYKMICKNTSCNEDENDPPIPAGTYNFSASGTFVINGVYCNFTKTGSITMP